MQALGSLPTLLRVLTQRLNCLYGMAFSLGCQIDAGINWLAIYKNSACTALTGFAAMFDTKIS
jgi:hypothetical protein